MLLLAPPLRPVLWLPPGSGVLQKISAGAAVPIAPAHQLGALRGAEHIGLRRDGLQPSPASVAGNPLEHPAGEDQVVLLPHHGGAHGIGSGRHSVALAPEIGPFADQHRRAAVGAQDILAVPVDGAALHFGVALRENKSVATRLPAGHFSVVVQVSVSAAGALHPHHPALPWLGPLVQDRIQSPVLHPLLLIQHPVGIQFPCHGLGRPGQETLRRLPGD